MRIRFENIRYLIILGIFSTVYSGKSNDVLRNLGWETLVYRLPWCLPSKSLYAFLVYAVPFPPTKLICLRILDEERSNNLLNKENKSSRVELTL